ncbi:MAG: glycerophosphodiester phosphodiesterase [Actinomycetales bacterium]|nr:glycerophosphodiester phosphodiesterase [Actinomycetales bacterium]
MPRPGTRFVTDAAPRGDPAERGDRGYPRGGLSHGVDVQGHRGARGLVPENTVAGFRAAIDAGCTGVELDVRLTADGEVVVWHDPTLQDDKCVCEGADLVGARIDALTLEQLRTVDVGSRTLAAYPRQRAVPGARIVTLAELFTECSDAGELWWTIEVKVDPTDPREVATRPTLVERVVEVIHASGVADRSFVHSFDWAVLQLAQQLDATLLCSALAVIGHTYAPGSPWLGTLRWEDHGSDLPAAAAALGASVLSPHFLLCTPDLVARSHELGLAVLPWTVNSAQDVRRVIGAGVDGLVTDVPDEVLALMADSRLPGLP